MKSLGKSATESGSILIEESLLLEFVMARRLARRLVHDAVGVWCMGVLVIAIQCWCPERKRFLGVMLWKQPIASCNPGRVACEVRSVPECSCLNAMSELWRIKTRPRSLFS